YSSRTRQVFGSQRICRPLRIVNRLICPKQVVFEKHHVGSKREPESRREAIHDFRPVTVEILLPRSSRSGLILTRDDIAIWKVRRNSISAENIINSLRIEIAQARNEIVLNCGRSSMQRIIEIETSFLAIAECHQTVIVICRHDADFDTTIQRILLVYGYFNHLKAHVSDSRSDVKTLCHQNLGCPGQCPQSTGMEVIMVPV